MLEKREIMLNEKDSIREMILFEEGLLKEYEDAAARAERREVKEFLLAGREEIKEDIQTLDKLLKRENLM